MMREEKHKQNSETVAKMNTFKNTWLIFLVLIEVRKRSSSLQLCLYYCMHSAKASNPHIHSILQIPKLRQREVEQITQDHTVSEHWRWKPNLDLSDLSTSFLICVMLRAG